MASKLENIGLTSLDDLFKTDAERQTEQGERVQIVPAEELLDGPDSKYLDGLDLDSPCPSENEYMSI